MSDCLRLRLQAVRQSLSGCCEKMETNEDWAVYVKGARANLDRTDKLILHFPNHTRLANISVAKEASQFKPFPLRIKRIDFTNFPKTFYSFCSGTGPKTIVFVEA